MLLTLLLCQLLLLLVLVTVTDGVTLLLLPDQFMTGIVDVGISCCWCGGCGDLSWLTWTDKPDE